MRVGTNPEKFKKELTAKVYHRVIIPVYIPELEGYFKDTLEIFKLNVESLLQTIHEKTRITIYNNNSHPSVKAYIDEVYSESSYVDQVFHSKVNLGKINAILAAVKGNLEPLITISDSDVFFKHDWQTKTEQVFEQFHNAGVVSPVPNSVLYKYYTANNFFEAFLGKSKIRFHKVEEPIGMKKFEDSLGDEVTLFKKKHLEKYMILEHGEFKAVMGAGHFVATIRREVFDKGSDSPAFLKIMGGIESKFIDKPNEDLGFLRLSTMSNYAYHLGNVTEDWMYEEFSTLSDRKPNSFRETLNFNLLSKENNLKSILGKAVRKGVLSKGLKKHYFRAIGMQDGADY